MHTLAEQFERYYHESKDKIFTYLMYRVQFDREVAEDLLMDIFLRAFEKFSQFDVRRGSFLNWIYAVARNRLYNYFRDHTQATSLEALEEKGFSPSSDPRAFVESADRSIEARRLLKALQYVPEDAKDLIIMKYVQDVSYPDLARMMGKNEGAVRTSLSRALSDLRAIYNRLFFRP